MPTDLTDSLGEVPEGKAVLLSHGAYEDIKDAIRASKPIAGKHMVATETDDGIILDLVTAIKAYPFQAIPGNGGEDGDTVIIKDALVGEFTPVIDGTLINASTPPELLASSGDDIFLKISVTPIAENIGTAAAPVYHVGGGTITAVEIVNEDPSGNDALINISSGAATDGVYYRRICTWTGVATETQPIETSLEWSVCSNGTSGGNSVAKLNLGRA